MAKNHRAGLVDVYVGSRLRERRAALGLFQASLGELIGITFQQIQKYESGANRISASRLFEFSRLLDVPVDYFFDGLPANLSKIPVPDEGLIPAEEPVGMRVGEIFKGELLRWIDAFYQITDEAVRHHTFELIKSLPPRNKIPH